MFTIFKDLTLSGTMFRTYIQQQFIFSSSAQWVHLVLINRHLDLLSAFKVETCGCRLVTVDTVSCLRV